MEALFSKDYFLLWALALGLALFFPVRQLLWVLYVRRAQRQGEIEEAETRRLRRRAGATAVLICFVFSLLYSMTFFGDRP